MGRGDCGSSPDPGAAAQPGAPLLESSSQSYNCFKPKTLVLTMCPAEYPHLCYHLKDRKSGQILYDLEGNIGIIKAGVGQYILKELKGQAFLRKNLCTRCLTASNGVAL